MSYIQINQNIVSQTPIGVVPATNVTTVHRFVSLETELGKENDLQQKIFTLLLYDGIR